MKTVVALYDNLSDAQRAVQELVNAGIDRDQINLIANDVNGQYAASLNRNTPDNRDTGDAAVTGAATGAVIGGVGGALLSLSALAIPGIGPIIAAGPLIAGLAGAGVGAAVGGLTGALVDAGIPEEHAQYYAEGIHRGGTLVAVQVPDDQADRVVRILDSFGPVDINQRAASWRQSGWTGFDGHDTTDNRWASDQTSNRSSSRTQWSDTNLHDTDNDEIAVDVVKEEVRIGKRQVEGEGVRVRKQVVEEPVEQQVRLRDEDVRVERRPVDRPATEADLRTFEEGTFEVEAIREEPVVEKQARVVEEVVIKKDARERVETVRDTARRTEVNVESADNGFRTYDTVFRNDFQTNFANRGYTYEQYEPAYRYGYTLASDPRYRGRDWNAIESDARTYWTQNYHDSPWEDFKDAVRHGWQRVKEAVRS